MKKKDIYEICLKLTGFLLLIYAFRPLLETVTLLIVMDKTYPFSKFLNDNLFSVVVKFFIYFIIGFMFIYKTGLFLRLFKFNDETTINCLSYFQTMHVVVVFIGALLIINNLEGVSSFRYFKETPSQEYYDFLNERMSNNESLPKHQENLSMKVHETRHMNLGSIVGVFVGILILIFSRKIAWVFISKSDRVV